MNYLVTAVFHTDDFIVKQRAFYVKMSTVWVLLLGVMLLSSCRTPAPKQSNSSITLGASHWPYRYHLSQRDGKWSGLIYLQAGDNWLFWDRMMITEQNDQEISFTARLGEIGKIAPGTWHWHLSLRPSEGATLTGDVFNNRVDHQYAKGGVELAFVQAELARDLLSATLPKEIQDFPVRTGMSATQVAEALHLSSVDSSQPLTSLRLTSSDNVWSGFYSVEFKDGVVSRVTFSRGSMSIVTGIWILSER